LFFGYRLGTGVPPWGPPPHPGPALHSFGSTALHYAAKYGNRRIVRLLIGFNAAVNARNINGCAVCARGESAVECAAPSPRRRLLCRYTPLHWAAYNGHSASVAELLLRGADGAVQNNLGG
jgi:ankyrin repeat protein